MITKTKTNEVWLDFSRSDLQDGFSCFLKEASKELLAWVDLYSNHKCVPLERKTEGPGNELQSFASKVPELFEPSRIFNH